MKWLFCALLVMFPAIATAFPFKPGNCSEAFFFCHELATCREEKSNNTFECVCGEGSMGPGFKQEGPGCFFAELPCTKNEDCHQDGFCDLTGGSPGTCKCNPFYVGDGSTICLDIDECLGEPCDPNANCQNLIGAAPPNCNCKPNYEGDGLTCVRVCTINADCHGLATCVTKKCVCGSGYEGDGILSCTDINECVTGDFNCVAPAQCKNNVGGFTCGCPNGFSGDGVNCTHSGGEAGKSVRIPFLALKQTCHQIFEDDATAVSGRTFELDQDGPGPLDSIMAKCEFRDGIGITIVEPVSAIVPVSSVETTIAYKDAALPQLEELVALSQFCYQSQWLECSGGYDLFKDNLMMWTDAAGNAYQDWGGSGIDGQCPCGNLGYCEQGTTCNCDGTSTTTGFDFGKITNASMLPVATVQFSTGTGSAKYQISELICAPAQIDILIDCDKIRDSGVSTDGPQLIDVDGKGDLYEPTLVHCDMTSYSHTGLTYMPHDKQAPIEPTETGSIDLNYTIPEDTIQGIIALSHFCSQQVRYECRNAPINVEGIQRVFVTASNESRILDYFPGGEGVTGNCGCGITCSCVTSNVTCNCDINDGELRYDIANHTKKADLPITAFNVDMSEVGAYTKVYIGPLICSEQQFGIEPNCEKYRAIGVSEPYSYLIDPDGPSDPDTPLVVNYPPFEAECKFNVNPPQGVTIIHHDSEETMTVTDSSFLFSVEYKNIKNIEQIKGLKARSTFCGQSLDFACTDYKLHLGGGNQVLWRNLDGNVYTYLHGGEGPDTGCRCNIEDVLTCSDVGEICNCDAAAGGTFVDDGELGNITHLPVAELDFSTINSQLGDLNFTLGPLKCFETFTNCYDLSEFLKAQGRIGEAVVEPGMYTIDPDRSGDDPPFTVMCDFPFTVVGVSPAVTVGPAIGDTQCYTVDYLDFDNNPITASQIASLVKSSAYCEQFLGYTCNNAAITNNVNFSSCDGRSQEGWALSGGYDTCSCGLTGTCVGGLSSNCNCDTIDGVERNDQGMIYNTSRLPVCEVCVSIDPIDGGNPPPGNTRSGVYNVGKISCSGAGFVGEDSCQDKRVTSSTDGVSYIDPKNGGPVVPVYCDMTANPNIGIMEFRLHQTEFIVPPGQPIDITPEYFSYDQADMEKLIDNSYYCTQEIFIDCNDGLLDLSGSNGWYSRAGVAQDTWGGNIGKTLKCEGSGTNCNCNKAGIQTDGGILGDKTLLPISRVMLNPHPSQRTLRIEPVKCYQLRPDCYHIMISGNLKTAHSPGMYVIDPDGPDGVDPFVVRCHFKSNEDNAVTQVFVENGANTPVSGQTADYGLDIPITYTGATPQQINTLAKQAPFCYQSILYECDRSPVTGSVRYQLYDGSVATGFGTGYDTNSSVCPCNLLGFCDGFSCRCDEQLANQVMDNGTITDKDLLPITVVEVGGQTDGAAASTVKVTSVQCEQKPTDFPKNCEDARKRGYSTGELMISPTLAIPPFFIYCDMEINNGHGTAVVNPIIETEKPIAYDGVPVVVPYKGLTDTQIMHLKTTSTFCYQPVKYNCKSTKFLEDDKFSWTGNSGVNTYFGSGTQANKDCTCGNENLCGGTDGMTVMQARSCNCDTGDDVYRMDSGFMRNKADLPIRNYNFLPTGIPGSEGNITIGQLFCSQNAIAFDECALGFHDCHPWAECVNTGAGFDCVCPVGFRGLKKPDNVFANGRECVDDDECSFDICPVTSVCTNLPGTFECTCNKGYHKEGPTTCRDINECVEVQYPNNCDVNAKCFNTEGSFYCKCRRGFRGEGTNGTCEGVGICACFGDPHCISFDERWLHFMGDCQYVMAQDGCDGGPRTFSVWNHNWDMNRDIVGITWVKDVTVLINTTRIYLGPDRVIRINGREFLGYRRDGISVDDNGREVTITADFGLEVIWDGGDEVEVFLDKKYTGKTCGLCGNYNSEPNDDWKIGDHCTATKGDITPNTNIFGNSWVVPEFLASTPSCDADCNAPDVDNSVCDDPVLSYFCDRVFDPQISPFADCLEVMDQELIDNLKFSCIFDICHVSDDVELGMCASAERVVNECNKNLDSETGSWRKVGFCAIQCEENKEYRLCGPRGYADKTRQLLCYDVRRGNQAPLLEYCAEGCYCLPGFVLEGQECILPDQCGCIVDGVYLSVGQTYINDDCTSIKTCLAGGTTDDQPLACSPQATCSLNTETGIFGCHCKPGFKGDGVNCGDDNCFNVTCPMNMECNNAVCKCKKGYTGDCNVCEDIDECATRTDDCIHLGQNCTNTNGGFHCTCIKGYVPFGQYCFDLDECEAHFDNCGAHAECVNIHGGFSCECCAGYMMSGGTCVVDGTTVPSGTKCCSCHGLGCSVDGKVCGDDGLTYNSEKALRIAACKSETYIEISYLGDCKSDCSSVECLKPYETCMVDILHGQAQCECPKCGTNKNLVCSSRLVSFINLCEFERVMCDIGDNDTFIHDDVTLCDKEFGAAVSPWSEWSACNVDCGAGEMFRTRIELRPRTTYELMVLPLQEVAICYANCTDGPCAGYNCSSYGEVCIPSVDNLSADCICPNCTFREDEPICGLLGNKQLTFKNKCELQKKACEVNQKPHLLSESACGALPLNCSLYTKYQDLSDGSCTSDPVPVGVCEGGCGMDPEKCCEAVETMMLPYSLQCTNGTMLNRQILSIRSCRCNYLGNV